jgi:hypothetical protein
MFASRLRNRFVNPTGGLETRQGSSIVGAKITTGSAADIKSLHELVMSNGTAVLLASGSAAAQGNIWRLDTSAASTWTQVYTSAGVDSSADFHAAQFDDRLILVNGVNRNIYTTDGSSYSELLAIIEQGEVETTATAHDSLVDDRITDWIAGTNVQVNDLLFDATTSAYAIITEVNSSRLVHQPLTAASPGISSGNAAKGGGDRYRIEDLVELNVIPVAGGDIDNLALAGEGSSAAFTQVSANNTRVNFANSQVRVGDYIRNTTRNQMARITGVSSNSLAHTAFGAAATSGDSLVFLKSAMPISDHVHVHYGRVYYTDVRDRHLIRISGPNDPQDMTTDAGTLDASTFKLGNQQPAADEIVQMASFQQYMVFGGKKYVTLFTGIDPIQDTSADLVAFSPQSQFPQGLASPHSMITIGNDLVFMTPDGLESAALLGSDTLPTREILSDALRTEIQVALSAANTYTTKVVNYPKRSLVFNKIGDTMYVFNYSPSLNAQAHGEQDDIAGMRGSWSIYDGNFAKGNDFLVRTNANLVWCDSSGGVYQHDTNVWTDGTTCAKYTTQYQTAFLGLDESRRVGRPSRQVKKGVAIMPTFQGSANATYTIAASSPYRNKSGESISVVVSGEDQEGVSPRIPLTWRGERVRLTFDTTAVGHDVLTDYTVLYNPYGMRGIE